MMYMILVHEFSGLKLGFRYRVFNTPKSPDLYFIEKPYCYVPKSYFSHEMFSSGTSE